MNNKPTKTHKLLEKQLRDPKGQIIGLMSLAYVFLAVVFCAWVINSGQALNYKMKMMSTCTQLAVAGAVFQYYGLNYFGWSFATIEPYISAAATNGFFPYTFGAYYPSFATADMTDAANSTGSCVAELQSNLQGFGGWVLPGSITDYRAMVLPTSLPAPAGYP